MPTFLLYSLKAAGCLAVFYLFYKLLLSRDTLHRMNRVLLCGVLLLSFLLPLCVITVEKELPGVSIIRKSKCSTDFKRNDFLKKTKRTHWVRFVHLNSLIESCVFLYLWNSPFDTFL